MDKANEGWKGRVKKVNMPVMPSMPAMPTRHQRETGSAGVIVPNNVRHRSFVG